MLMLYHVSEGIDQVELNLQFLGRVDACWFATTKFVRYDATKRSAKLSKKHDDREIVRVIVTRESIHCLF